MRDRERMCRKPHRQPPGRVTQAHNPRREGREGEGDCGLEDDLGYTVRPCLKPQTKRKKKEKAA